MCGINVGLMQELGYTVLEQDEDGNDLAKIDWSRTRAIQSEGNDIYINLKGREPHGIVEPEEQYELEEQIMTDLYGYRHPDSGKRVIALAPVSYTHLDVYKRQVHDSAHGADDHGTEDDGLEIDRLGAIEHLQVNGMFIDEACEHEQLVHTDGEDGGYDDAEEAA